MCWLLPDWLTDERCKRYGWLLLLLLCAILYLPGIGTLPLMDRDEPRFAHATVEMMERHSWAIPYFNGEYRFDKPPLAYWWMRFHYCLFGVREASARLHSVVATWLVALVISSIGRRWFDAGSGLIGGIAWLTTTQVFIHGRLCVADMPMVLSLTLALRGVIEILPFHDAQGASGKWSRWHWLLYVSLGVGFLAKGPIVFIVPAFALLLHRFVLWRRPVSWRHLHIVKGAALALVIIGAWGVPALIQTDGLFWKVGMGGHVIDRGTRALNGRFVLPGYYLAASLFSLFPWIALLPQTWRAVRQQYDARLALLVCWVASPYLVFSFYATQLPHYVMPGFPAAMLLLIAAKRPDRRTAWWPALVVLAWCGAAALLAFAAIHFDWPQDARPLIRHATVLMGMLAVFGGLIVVALLVRSKIAAVSAIAALMAVAACVHYVSGSLRSLHAGASLSPMAKDLGHEVQFVACGFTEPSLVFHFDRHWKYVGRPATLDKILSRNEPAFAIALRREWTLSDCLKRAARGHAVVAPSSDLSAEVDPIVTSQHPSTQRHVFVFNAARMSWAELAVMFKSI